MAALPKEEVANYISEILSSTCQTWLLLAYVGEENGRRINKDATRLIETSSSHQ